MNDLLGDLVGLVGKGLFGGLEGILSPKSNCLLGRLFDRWVEIDDRRECGVGVVGYSNEGMFLGVCRLGPALDVACVEEV